MTEQKKTRLLCFHFAGGNKYSYPGLDEMQGVECRFFELPGRGERFGEKLLRDMEDALLDLFFQVKPILSGRYALFGHSMGALVSFLLAHLIRSQGLTMPEHLFLSGRVPPSVTDEADKLYLLQKDRFWQGIRDFGGVPDELLRYPDLMELYEPMIRADLQVIDSYEHSTIEPLDIPISVFHGSREKINHINAKDWQKFTRIELKIFPFSGDHFFILHQMPEVRRLISKILS